MTRFTFGAWIGLAFAFAFAATWPFRGDWAQSIANGTLSRPLVHAKSWRVQHNRVNLDELVTDRSDLLVIDAGRYGKGLLTPGEVARLKLRSDGTRRLVVARFAIGEVAETSATWNGAWTAEPPEWLGEHHCAQPTVRRVRYWLPEWKNILFRAPGSNLERMIAAGFDGIALGGLDVFTSFEAVRPSARREMIQIMRELAAAARVLKPGFIVIAQNAETLLSDPDYRMIIDGIAIEGLLYSANASGERNAAWEISQSMALLRVLQMDGKPIFAIEYLRSAALIDQAAVALQRRGIVATFDARARDDGTAARRESACPSGAVW